MIRQTLGLMSKPTLCLLAAATALLSLVTSASAQSVLTLEEAIETAREENRQVEIARANIDSAATYLDIARNVFVPALNASGQYTFYDQEVAFAGGNPYEPILPYLEVIEANNPGADLPPSEAFAGGGGEQVIQPRNEIRGAVTLTQNMYNSRAFSLRRQADIQQVMAANGIEEAQYAIEGLVIDAYFVACAQQRFIEIARQTVENTQTTYERAVALQELGVGTLFEVNRSLVDVEGAQQELLNAELSLDITLRGLAQLINRDEVDFTVELPAELSPALVAASDVDLDSVRPELIAAQTELEFSEEQIQESSVAWHPLVYFQASGTFQQQTAFNPDIFRWNLAVIASWDILDRGMRRAEREQREVVALQNELALEEERAQIQSQIDMARLELDQAIAAVEIAERRADLARRNYGLTNDALEIGTATQLDVTFAQQQLSLAELALADAEVTVQSRIYRLRYLLGE